VITERPTHWLTWDQLLRGVETVSLINEPISDEVDFTVDESAEARARRRWFARKHEKDI
jgi:hypothetical protein